MVPSFKRHNAAPSSKVCFRESEPKILEDAECPLAAQYQCTVYGGQIGLDGVSGLYSGFVLLRQFSALLNQAMNYY